MHFITLASVALTAVAGTSAISVPHSHVRHARIDAVKPDTYYEGYLEPYKTYHTRYLAIDCEEQHNTTFFDRCCHPMLATETLAKNRDADCNPANRVASSVIASATTHVLVPTSVAGGDDDDEDCDDDEPTTTVHSAAPTSTADDDDEDCDDGSDEPESTTTASPSTHKAATSTQKAASSTHSAAPATTEAPTTTQAPATTHTTSTKPQTTKEAPTTTKSSASSQPTSGSGDDEQFTGGHATFFYQGGQAGACGKVNPDSAYIAALQTERYGNLSAKSSNCGRRIKLTNTNNGKSVEVTVADACPTCGNHNDLDLSEAAFKQIASLDDGYVPIKWSFLD